MNQQEKAVSYLKNLLNTGQWKPGDQLPSMQQLGKDAHISHPVMARAVHELSRQGLLSVFPSSGIRVPISAGGESGPVIKRIEKWKKVKSQITKDIFSRTLDASLPLPTVLELRHRYGVSYPILKKALCSLEYDGLLSPYKKTYKPNLFSTSRHKTKILVLINMIPGAIDKNGISLNDKGFYTYHRGHAFIHDLERLCNSQNLAFDIYGYHFENDAVTFISPTFKPCSWIDHIDRYYGICIFNTIPFTANCYRLFSRLGTIQVPMAIFNESGYEDLTLPRMKNKNVRIFPVAQSDVAAQKIGRYLLEFGHRVIAYISPWHKEAWSQNRYHGICTACDMVGNSSSVRVFVDERYPAGVVHLDDKNLDESLLHVPRLENILKTQTNFSPEQQKLVLSTSWLNNTFLFGFNRPRFELFMLPLFEKALADREVTAWVCADDQIALLALHFLRKKRVDVPGRISVMGFEDIEEAFEGGLSSYNYDIQGMVQTVLAFFSNPTLFPARKSLEIECNGFLVARQSTGHAPKIR